MPIISKQDSQLLAAKISKSAAEKMPALIAALIENESVQKHAARKLVGRIVEQHGSLLMKGLLAGGDVENFIEDLVKENVRLNGENTFWRREYGD